MIIFIEYYNMKKEINDILIPCDEPSHLKETKIWEISIY